MDVWLADFRLHDTLYGFRVEDAHGDILGDNLFVLSPERGLEMFGLEKAIIFIFLGERVIVVAVALGAGFVGCWSVVGCSVGCGCSGDGHGEYGKAILFGETEGGGETVSGGFEGPLERL